MTIDAHRLYLLIGRRLRRARGALTQSELAERTRGVISRSTIANIESGRQRPSMEQLFALAAALSVEPLELLPTMNEITQTGTPARAAGERTDSLEDWRHRVLAGDNG